MLGMIKKSAMDYEEFKKNHDATWVEIQGQDISGSDFANLTGITQLPNAEGCFFRQAGDSSGPIGIIQADSTAKNGLNCVLTSGNVTTKESIGHSHKVYCTEQSYDDLNVQNSQHLNDSMIYNPPPIENIQNSYNICAVEQHTPNVVQTDTQLASMSFDRNQLNSRQTITGGSDETRPINIAFYHYIKINN